MLQALRLDPGLAEAHNNLGLVRMEPGERACALEPRSARVAAALGVAFGMLKRYPDAIAALERARGLDPGDVAAQLDLAHLKQHVCDWDGLAQDAAAIRAAARAGQSPPLSPFFFMMLPGTTAREQRACAERWARAVAAEAGVAYGAAERRPGTGSRLRIGYLSGDFHGHAGMRLMAGVLEHHDRARFEIFGFSYGPRSSDPMRARCEAAFDEFVDVSGLDDRSAAEAIRARGIDILVVREPYTLFSRTGIAALQPAAVQVSFLGYPGTTGAPFIDWLIADRFVVPPEAAEAYSERIARLPDTYQCNDDARVQPAVPARADCGLDDDAFVFCCFNQTYKIGPEILDVWCRLLIAVPGSVLWLWASNPWVADNLRAEAGGRGVDPARLVFAPTVGWEAHVARVGAADLFVDTFPCTAHTTASDALWAGVPVVTCAGDTFVSRVAGSVLRAAGLPELVTRSLADYEALALRLARASGALDRLRDKLAAKRATAPLFDTARFTRNLEAVYERIWRSSGAR